MTLEEFCSIYNVSEQDIKGSSRKSDISILRQLFAFILVKQGKHPEEVAKTICRDRSTVLYAVKNMYDLIEVRDKRTTEYLSKVKNIIIV